MACRDARSSERLALASFDFVATKVFLGFSVGSVLTRDWVVLFKTDFLSGILSILCGVVCTVTSKFAHQTNQLTLRVLLCHS